MGFNLKHVKPILRIFLFFISSSGLSIDFSMNTYVGVMQQPASHFYHTIYGANSQVIFFKRIHYRMGIFERPEFKSEGYIDKDYGYYGMFGGVVAEEKSHLMRAFVGHGINRGYIYQSEQGENTKRSYFIKGLIFSMEYSLDLKNYEVNLAHSQFVGSNNREHLKAFVAWPFSFFSLGLGYKWK
jgi:hypothetical protein